MRRPFWVAVQEMIRSIADRVVGLPECLGPELDASAPVTATWRYAPPLTVIFLGKTSAHIRRTGEVRP